MTLPSFDGVTALVTGGAGFIGSHLVEDLLRRGAAVRVLDDLSTGSTENLRHCRDRVELLVQDIRDPEACRRACSGVELVFHQAAVGSVPRSLEEPGTTMAINVSGTANVFAAARDAGVRRVVYASSSSVYGDGERLPKREGEEGRAVSPYALSKQMNEQLGEAFGRFFGLELVGLRYFNVFGPRQSPEGPYAAVIPRFLGAFLSGQRPVIFGDGEQSRDFTFVADAVRANLLGVVAPAHACGRCYNVGAGERTSVNLLARLLREATGARQEPTHAAPRPGDVRHSYSDLALARKQLGFEPRVPLAQGLALTVAAWRQSAASGAA